MLIFFVCLLLGSIVHGVLLCNGGGCWSRGDSVDCRSFWLECSCWCCSWGLTRFDGDVDINNVLHHHHVALPVRFDLVTFMVVTMITCMLEMRLCNGASAKEGRKKDWGTHAGFDEACIESCYFYVTVLVLSNDE